jgi:hypothetical protein
MDAGASHGSAQGSGAELNAADPEARPPDMLERMKSVDGYPLRDGLRAATGAEG